MFAIGIDEQRNAHPVQSRVARLGAAAAALAITLTGFSAVGADAVPIGAWQIEGTLTGDVDLPQSEGVAVDHATGDVYLTDSVQGIVKKFNRAGALIRTRVVPDASAVAVAPSGDLYVASGANDFIKKYDREGTFLYAFGKSGTGDGEFNFPNGIAVNAAGEVFVSDRGNDRVQRFDGGDGHYLGEWGGPGAGNGKFAGPRGLAISPSGDVYVVDQVNDRVQAFTSIGTFKGTWGSSGSGKDELTSPTGIAFDDIGQIYVADWGNSRFVKYTADGTPLTEMNLDAPRGIAVDPVLKRVYAAQGAYGAAKYRQTVQSAFVTGPVATTIAGRDYKAVLKASGFPAVIGFKITVGQLPKGLKLVGSVISGVPTAPGSYQVTLQADNTVVPIGSKSYTIKVYKSSSKVTARFSTKHPGAARTNIRATIKVSAPYTTGLSKTGKVRVYYGKKRVKTYTVKASSKGVIKVRLPKFTKTGKTKVTLKYSGNSQLKPAKRTIYVRVR